nr:type VI secretion system baseplate subunit TssK [Pseudomonas aeruginosa]
MSVLPDAVCWHEGMQLLPQHFQLQGLRAEALAARIGQACNPWFWGVTALELDPSALCAGQVRVLHLEAILPDGLPVSVQAGVDAPLEFDLETALAAAEGPLLNVHLAVSPLWRAGQLLPLKGRLQSRVGAPLPDLASGEHPEPITVWRASLRLVGDDGKADSVCLPLLRVAKEGGAYVSLPYVPPTPLILPESPLGRRVQSLCARAREKALFLGGRLRLAQQAGNQDDAVEIRRQLAALWTRLPPEHLVGRNLGEVRYVLCASERYLEGRDATEPAMLHWIAPDDFLPNHPSVVWRRRHYPGVLPAYRCNGVLAVAEMARAGLGLAAIPAYLLRDGDGLRVLDADLEGCASALWLLTRPDCRALRSVVALFDELGRHVRLGDE